MWSVRGRDLRFVGSEYSEIHKVHTLHSISARVNFVKFGWDGWLFGGRSWAGRLISSFPTGVFG
jgi:hypothetical protein